MLVGITLSTNLSGRMIERSGRYKAFPLAGLAMMSAALALLAIVVEHPSRVTTGFALGLFGLGFGMVGQVLIIAVQNGVSPARIMRFVLNARGDGISRADVLDQNWEVADEPTIGTIANGHFVYVANSQWEKYDEKMQRVRSKPLTRPRLLAVPLPR